MFAINKVLLPECTGEECGGGSDICTGSRVHHRNAENRAPVTRNHRGTPSPPQLQVWTDATAPWMLAHFMAATGNPVVVTGGSFLRAVEGSWELKQEESQYKAQLLEKARAAAAALRPGQSTTVRLDVKDFTYTMPGAKLNPFGRYLGFGEIHVNIDGSLNVRKSACGDVKYNGVVYFNGFDRYQWGTAMHSPNVFSRWGGDFINSTGTPFNSYWDWTEPIYGELQ
jgi:hypothetical protein